MPIFGEQSSHFDDIVEKATNETNTGENWALILDICDRVSREGTRGAKAFILSVKKRLNNRDPHVVLLALSVLDSAVSNCGALVLNEMCTREFIAELRSKAVTSNRGVAEKTRILLKKWSDEHKDAAFSLMSSLVKDLASDGYSFESSEPQKSRKPVETSDPNFVSSAEEEAAIAKAIAASLKEAPASASSGLHSLNNGAALNTHSSTTTSIYPSSNTTVTTAPLKTASHSTSSSKTRPVKALYDFEAAEDNELTFKAGELITVTDDSDINWWRGSNSRGEGLFPANFVTSDLSAQVVTEVVSSASATNDKRSVQFDDNVQVKELEKPVVIDENSINRCMELLDDADPTGEVADSDELLQLEENCQRQMPLIDDELADIDARYNQLADVDIRLRDALALYDTSMQQASHIKFAAHAQQVVTSAVPPGAMIQQQPGHTMAGMPPQQQQPGMMVQPVAHTQPPAMPAVPQSSHSMPPQQQTVMPSVTQQQQQPIMYPPQQHMPQQQQAQYFVQQQHVVQPQQ